MTTRRNRPYLWITWLSRVLVGEKSCHWASWFKAHFQDYAKVPGDFNEARWRMDHTRLLSELVTERERAGDEVRIESQNRFRFEHRSGLVVAGTPDLVAKGSGTVVFDCKTGRQKASDLAQVMLYMYFLPRFRPEYLREDLSGSVVYRTYRIEIPARAIDDEFRNDVEYWLRILGGEVSARRVPSEMECGFCELTRADCKDRVESNASALKAGRRTP